MLSSVILSVLCASASASSVIPRILSPDDIILYSKDGHVEVRRRADYPPLNNRSTMPPANGTIIQSSPSNHSPIPRSLEKRDTNTIIIPNPSSDFLGWDVPMSSVVKGDSSDSTTVSVTQGYSITNTLSVGVSSQLTLIEDFLSTTLSIDYSQSWQSSYAAAYTFKVPAGKYGAVVSNPQTHRESGTIFEGRIGSEGTVSTYQADSFSSKAYDSLSWVDGVISVCVGDTYPLQRCLGEGTI